VEFLVFAVGVGEGVRPCLVLRPRALPLPLPDARPLVVGDGGGCDGGMSGNSSSIGLVSVSESVSA